MKVRHTYPTGQTSASKIKALLLCLEAKRGAKAADAWLSSVRLGRADLEDETRLLPLAALHAALGAFLEELPDGMSALAPYLVAPENLGVWARVLRGTRAPEEAFGRIDSSDSEHGRTTRWETLEARGGYWRGVVRIGHDPALEKDGLLAKARKAELAVVPMLFGFPPAEVTTHASSRVPSSADPHASTSGAHPEQDADALAGTTQEYEVRWAVPTTIRGVTTGAAIGVAVGGISLTMQPSLIGGLVAMVAPLVLGGVGLAWSRDRLRRVEAGAQSTRVHALERSLALRDSEGKSGAGDLEGNVVAGQYRIGARMGSGASGVIYEATRITDGLPVAIKLLRAATAHDAVASDRLRREAEALGLSWHPNVVEVIDHGHLPDGTSYLVMELLQGEPLATRLKDRGRITPEELLPIALHVVDAVVAIHAAGVVHRDLKPANIYLTHDAEEGERAKILDFGIARVEWEEMRITNMGAPMGTPGYMSPEQETGGEVDARSDVYAVGAVLYECLVGEPPPPSLADLWVPGKRLPSSVGLRLPPLDPAPKDALARTDGPIAEGSPGDARSGVHPASRRMPSAAPSAASSTEPVVVPPVWRDIIEKALAKKPEDRYQDARSMLAELRRIGATETPPAAAESPSEASSS
ncbi:MAG: serine/threonine protein kinase [Deltaproteobacteria bacterium]|nr:serine/threonine protein kinase [Deltaproteobacteria bacterium]